MQTEHIGQGQPRVSVLMPTFNQAAFLRRALESLRTQTLTAWELVILDDGSTDDTPEVVALSLPDPRIRSERRPQNGGLGVALNAALALARASLIAYLPSDDLYYPEHLASLVCCLEAHPDAVLAYSGLRHHGGTSSPGQIEGAPLQLVQVLHRRTDERWLERAALVTDDLERMYWGGLRARGAFVGAGRVTCEWVDHPAQRHKVIQERPFGGLNPYRSRYGVREPLRFQPSIGNHIDEVARYRRFRERPATPRAADGLTILLVGELAFNPERVLALEERGHRLHGLWLPDPPFWFNTVGPLPFGHVADLPRDDWRAAVRELRPDLVYALLNWHAVPFAHEVLTADLGVPFVWHFKEGPFFCLERGLWPQLIALHTRADGQIYSSPELRDWFAMVAPESARADRTLVLDGDLPKREWFTADRAPLLSAADGEVHTVVPGRPVGLEVAMVGELARHGIHLHCYGEFQGSGLAWRDAARRVAPRHLHTHPSVGQEDWVAELSRYDAGWLHLFRSENGGDIRRAAWDDLNYPARLATLAAAGLPFIQCDNGDAVVATQALARRLDVGLFFREVADLAPQLRDRALLARLRDNLWRGREQFTFDYHADRLIAFFRQVIAARRAPR